MGYGALKQVLNAIGHIAGPLFVSEAFVLDELWFYSQFCIFGLARKLTVLSVGKLIYITIGLVTSLRALSVVLTLGGLTISVGPYVGFMPPVVLSL